MKSITILEFNEEQQMFHYNSVVDNVPKDQENRLGWKTLIYCKDDSQASLLADFLKVHFLNKGISKFNELEYIINSLTKFISRFN